MCRFDAGKFNYGVDNRTLLAIEFFLFAWVELRRYQDMKKPGATNQDPIFKENSLPGGNEPGYPGEALYNIQDICRRPSCLLVQWNFSRLDYT